MMKLVLAIIVCLFGYSKGQNPPYKAVNLGAWLVTEGWMTPYLFDAIPNKDLLDGTRIHIRSTKLNMYLCAEHGGGSALVANRTSASGWETFRLWRIDQNTFNFRVFNKDFVGLTSFGDGQKAYARVAQPGRNETFIIQRNPNNPMRVRIQAHNGLYLRANTGDSVKAEYSGSLTDWSDQNPSVFDITITGALHGEYQLTNGYGPNRAPSVLMNHWNSYIVADDFRWMSQNGLTAVRIPVGWWIMYQSPPRPYVAGSLQALDNAFTWAQQYGIKVIIDLHAAQGSQNGNDHSSSRDGYLEWGPSQIPQTVACIDFLAQRYGGRLSLVGIELLNEPLAPEVSLNDLTNFYRQGYAAVRRYTSSAYVILSNRLGPASNTELLPLARELSHRVVIDVHYYNLYSDYFSSLNANQNIDYIYNERARSLQEVTTSNGPLSFVGEWSGEWSVQNAPMQDYQRYARAQLDVYSRASFGWAYWSYKCEYPHWSLRWMVDNNYIRLQ